MVPDSYGKLPPKGFIREEHESVTEEPLEASTGPQTSSDTGFTGPVCSLLSSVKEMQYNADFRGVPGVKNLTEIPEYILVNMSTDQQMAHHSPVAHVHVDQKHGLTGKELNTLEILVKYCLQVYFKLYYNIKVHPRLEDCPKHILMQLKVMRSQPKRSNSL
ncbi:hypothetical protein GWK47_043081 [Chionoecetes opilio]|uniref:Uncharacterized protein n=1 Tax=Chionoecetes opilio TaxID=41210 RepID=A0A8J4YHS6_CHIOP|nr:hypothetical protein GWK47_043081 [Chionoecetes opilio]